MSKKGYAVVKIDKDGNVLERYTSYNDAARQNLVNVRTISARCNRQMKQYEMLFDPNKCDMFTFRHEDDKSVGDIYPKPPTKQRVCMIDRMGNVQEVFDTIKDASDAIGWTQTKIWRRCNGLAMREWAKGEKVTFRWEGNVGQ